MNEITLPAAFEPDEWNVAFHVKSARRLLSVLACGRFKHVSAFAYCPGFKAWLVYDTQIAGTRLMLIAHNEVAALATYTKDCVIVKIMAPRQHMGLSPLTRLGFYCVPAIKHLLGVRCASIRPDALYRHILRHGGVVICPKPAASTELQPSDIGRCAAARST